MVREKKGVGTPRCKGQCSSILVSANAHHTTPHGNNNNNNNTLANQEPIDHPSMLSHSNPQCFRKKKRVDANVCKTRYRHALAIIEKKKAIIRHFPKSVPFALMHMYMPLPKKKGRNITLQVTGRAIKNTEKNKKGNQILGVFSN